MAILTRFDPLREMFRWQEDLARGLDERSQARSGESVGWTPACDIFEDVDAVSVRVELAGVEPKDVEVHFENGVLTLKGDRKLEQETHRENYHRIESAYGAFTRSFALPTTIDAERIAATSKNGMLTITLPKKAEVKPRPIKVQVT
jgi:HSP20 family protein